MRSQEVNDHPVVANLIFRQGPRAVGIIGEILRHGLRHGDTETSGGRNTARIRRIVGNPTFGTQPFEVAVLGRVPCTRKNVAKGDAK